MPLSWNEIKDRALAFSREWADETREDAEAKSFWDGFFHCFGISRRRVASFEAPVRRGEGNGGFIDLLWKGVLLVEHKSRGRDLNRAYRQALDYFPGLKERDLPRYVLVSDFARLRLYDLDPPVGRTAGAEGEVHEFPLAELHKHVRLFGFIAGYQTRSFGQEDPVNVEAARRLGLLHDQLQAQGYGGHALEVMLVRLLFCLFAEDTAIFERQQLRDYIEQRTGEDGADLGMHLAQLFQLLDTAPERRQKNLDEQLAAFPYVNGQLFREPLPIPACDRVMRETLLDCCALDWSRISPAIFGSLFQSIMDKRERRNLGAHYTSETNILKALRPLFLDGLRAEFERIRRQPRRLVEFHQRLARLRLLDPACGCGNFLVIAYRELRLLELDVLRELHKGQATGFLDVGSILWVDVDQFYGIEIEEFPAQIAQVALWLTDHQMNLRVSEEFGQYFVRLPLRKAPHIVHGNALALEWREVVRPEGLSYIVGNPPFIGHQWRNDQQMADMARIWGTEGRFGRLDYVACWYRKAAEYMAAAKAQPSEGLEPAGGSPLRTAFVSTNSITQGEQVGILWPDLFRRGVKIHFAHRTFQWTSEARGKAAVHCVIIGFGLDDTAGKCLYDYETVRGEPHAIPVENINGYLVAGPDLVMPSRTDPQPGIPQMKKGSQPTDGGFLVLDDAAKGALLAIEPDAEPWLRPYMGGEELIASTHRWCLWLKEISPEALNALPEVKRRVAGVREARLKSPTKSVRDYAELPTLFTQDRQPDAPYLAVPEVSSEGRRHIPMAFLPAEVVASNKLQIIVGAGLYHLGVLSSTMHMAWMRTVAGRLKSDYSYSPSVYNNFPWPAPTDKQREAIESCAQAVLEARAAFPGSTLADLYDPLTMPPLLLKAHRALDRAVDAAYGKTSFAAEAERVAFLFERYRQLTSLIPTEPAAKTRRAKRSPD